MKYLVISKGPSLAHGADAEHLHKAREVLQKGLESGKVEACYGLVDGGTVWIINAENNAALTHGLRVFHLASVHKVDVYPIVDGVKALEAFIDHKNAGYA